MRERRLELQSNEKRLIQKEETIDIRIKEIEKQELIEALTKTGGNQSRAAEILGVSRVTVWNRMKRFGIQTPRQIHSNSVKNEE